MAEDLSTNSNDAISLLKVVAQGVTTLSNQFGTLIDAQKQLQETVSSEGSSLSNEKELSNLLKDLGIVVGKRSADTGKFVRGGQDEALKTLFRVLIGEQKKANKIAKDASKEAGKEAKKQNNLSGKRSEQIKEAWTSFIPGHQQRHQIAGFAKLLTRGRPLTDAQMGKLKWWSYNRFKPRVLGSALYNASTFNTFPKGGSFGLGMLKAGISMLIVEVLKYSYQMLQNAYTSMATGTAYQARGGRMNKGDYRDYQVGMTEAARMGVTGKEFQEKTLQYQKLGLGWHDALSGIAVGSAYGVENVGPIMQTLKRRTDAEQKYAGNMSRAFAGFQPLVSRTGLSMTELSEAADGFIKSMRGFAGMGTTYQALGKFGGMVSKGQLEWSDVASFYTKPQDSDLTNLLLFTRSAVAGGFNIEGDTLLGKAYNMRRLKDPQRRAEAYGAGLRSEMLARVGTTNLSKVSADEKAVLFEAILPKLGLGGLERNPYLEEIVSKLVTLGGRVDQETLDEIDNYINSAEVDRIAKGLDTIAHPVNQIRNYLAGKALSTSDKEALYSQMAADAKRDLEAKKIDTNVHLTQNIVLDQSGKFKQVNTVPGSATSVESK